MFHWVQPLLYASAGFETFGPHKGFLTTQGINTGNKHITGKTYDKSKTRTRQKQRIVTPGDPYGQTTPLKYQSKRKHPVETRMTKQQKKLSLAQAN